MGLLYIEDIGIMEQHATDKRIADLERRMATLESRLMRDEQEIHELRRIAKLSVEKVRS